jgi:sugar phosphate isomerase/epimerase
VGPPTSGPPEGDAVTDERLLATCWTTAGNAAPLRGEERSPIPIRERVEAAAAAGFRGIGLLHVDLMPALDQYGVRGLRVLLEDNGIVDLELELLTNWWTAGPARHRSNQVRRDLLDAAEALGAHHIKIGPDVSGNAWNYDRWVTEFAALATDAADAGTRIGLEFLPWSNIKTVHDGLRLVQAAGSPGGGLIIDVWHTERAHTPPADLAAVPLRYIVGVELDDADSEPVGTLFEDTIDRRRLCGEGSFDLPAIIDALRTAGWRGPWGVEILSEQHRLTPLQEGVTAAYRTALAQLARKPAH